MAVEHQQLKKTEDKFQTSYTTYLNELEQNSTLAGEEFAKAQQFYNDRSDTITKEFTDLFAVEEKTDQILQPNLEKLKKSLDEVEEKKHIVKRGLLKKEVEVTNREEILGSREVHLSMVRQESSKYAGLKAKIRRELPDELKAVVGDYETMTCLSDFCMEMRHEDKAQAMENFSRMIKNYGGTSDDAAENTRQRFAAMDELTGMIMKIDLKSINLSSDEAIAMNAARLERISGMTKSFETLLKKNPDYLAELKTRKTEDGASLGDRLTEKMGLLGAMSDYYRVKKLLISDETYASMLNSEIGMEPKEEDSFALARIKKLQRAAYYLGQNLSAKTNKDFAHMPLETEIGSLEETDDKAMRQLSADPDQQDYFDNIQREKVEKLYEEKKTTDESFRKAQIAREDYVKKHSADYEKILAGIKEFEELEKKNEKEVERLTKQKNEYLKMRLDAGNKGDEKKKKECEAKVREINGEIAKLAGGAEKTRLEGEKNKYEEGLKPLDEEFRYWEEEVKIIDKKISYESNLTERERIDRVIKSLEAERFYVPSKWDKMSLDVPEKNDDPDFVESTATKTNGYLTTYTEKSGRKPIREFMQTFKEKHRPEGADTIALTKIAALSSEHRYNDPVFDHFDRMLDFMAGPLAFGYSNEEMMEQFEIFADVEVPARKEKIMSDPKLKAYYESAGKEFVKKLHQQIYSVNMRLKNGLGDLPFALTPVDMIMQMNSMLRSDFMAAAVHTNPLTTKNMRYVRQLFKEDNDCKFNVDVDDYLTIGKAYSGAPWEVQGYVSWFFTNGDEDFSTKEERAKLNKYIADYRKKHPDSALTDELLLWEYARTHVNEFNTRAKLLRKCEDPTTEKLRLERLQDLKNAGTASKSYAGFVDGLKSGRIKRTSKEKLLAYNEKLKRECPELGLKGFKTKGQDDPFMILRLIDGYKVTAEEEKRVKDKNGGIFEFAEWAELMAKEEKKKKK